MDFDHDYFKEKSRQPAWILKIVEIQHKQPNDNATTENKDGKHNIMMMNISVSVPSISPPR